MNNFKINIPQENLQDLLIAIEYTIDKYDLYKKEEFVEDLKNLKKIIFKQINENIKRMKGY